MRNRLGQITVQLSKAYPHATADVALRAQARIDELRSRLDDIVFREYPTISPEGNSGVYYPSKGKS
jgi:hypothetical protein